jgi:hypothetical protein
MAKLRPPHPALLVVVALLAAATLAASFAVGRSLVLGGAEPPPASPRAPSPQPSTTAAAPALPEGFVAFRDAERGLFLGYPATWRRLQARDPEVALLVSAGGRDSLQVRVAELGVEVDAGSVQAVRALTDRLVIDSPGVKLLRAPEQIELAGLPGVHYFYSFDAGRRTGVHSHYFLFDGDRMIVLVFQALPQRRFVELADTFDLIAETLVVERAGG